MPGSGAGWWPITACQWKSLWVREAVFGGDGGHGGGILNVSGTLTFTSKYHYQQSRPAVAETQGNGLGNGFPGNGGFAGIGGSGGGIYNTRQSLP